MKAITAKVGVMGSCAVVLAQFNTPFGKQWAEADTADFKVEVRPGLCDERTRGEPNTLIVGGLPGLVGYHFDSPELADEFAELLLRAIRSINKRTACEAIDFTGGNWEDA